jgi:hypothetical protein
LQGVEPSFQVMATGMGHEDGGTEKEQAGSIFFSKNDIDEHDKGEDMNPMEYVSNNGEKISIYIYIYIYILHLQSYTLV